MENGDTPRHPVFSSFSSSSKSLIEAYLDKRHRNHCVLAHRARVPEEFATKITLEEHQKAAQYTVAKIEAGQWFHLMETVVLLAWTMGGGLDRLDGALRRWDLSEVHLGLVFFGLFSGISLLLSLPRNLYMTFVIEERFGFNKTTPKLFVVDTLKSILLGLVIGGPVLYGILSLMELVDHWWFWAWAFLVLVQLVLIWAYPAFIAPLFNKFTELEEGEVKERILSLLARTGFTSKGLFVMDASRRSSHGNAYFTGFGKNKRIVFFDNLMTSLEAQEVEAVLAHELGHFKRRHIVKGMVKSMVLGLVGFAILGALSDSLAFYAGHGVTEPSTYMALCLFVMVSGIYTFPLTPFNAWLSRKWEFEADAFASRYARADKLISALVKLYKDNAST